jgi:hypothetical protein
MSGVDDCLLDQYVGAEGKEKQTLEKGFLSKIASGVRVKLALALFAIAEASGCSSAQVKGNDQVLVEEQLKEEPKIDGSDINNEIEKKDENNEEENKNIKKKKEKYEENELEDLLERKEETV